MNTRLYRSTDANLQKLAEILRGGDLVAVPTETVYGLAADAMNQQACRKIFAAKNRPNEDPLIIHVADIEQATGLAHWNETANKLADTFWPGPLTLVLRKKPVVSDIITAGLDSVAIRLPLHPVFRALLNIVKIPLAAPSANPFGYISPTTSRHVMDHLQGEIPAILEGGPCDIGVESSIVDLRDERNPRLLRPGGIPETALSEVLGRPIQKLQRSTSTNEAAVAPGLLDRHYSPRTKVRLHHKFPKLKSPDEAWVFFSSPSEPIHDRKNSYVLSPDGKSESAAKRLYSLLRSADAKNFGCINIEQAPPADPWAEAINDRLQRAAAS
ncbi:L-threonylcarbamoyladenylate synthase [Opitutaceae bacterium]|nr:L-threonylcarbamoyladenylate synthase [Opitutaceae bacterium]